MFNISGNVEHWCTRNDLTEVELRTQRSRPRSRTQKNPRPRPRTAFPRTEPLEAKDRNARGQCQGHSRKCSAKKRSSKKFFRQSPIHRRSQNFWLEWPKPQITCNDVIKNFQKRKFLWDKDILEWKIWNRCLLALNQDFAKREGLSA